MSILGDLVGSIFGGGGNSEGGIAGALVNQLSQPGTLQAVLGQLQQAGLSEHVQSWLGNGSNLPISEGQLGQLGTALGPLLGNLASSTGQSQGDVLQQIAQHLPSIVNGLTPNGQVPGAGDLGQIAGGFLQQYLGKQS
jgi:uncharacterized protein YidB (DUF937 family)